MSARRRTNVLALAVLVCLFDEDRHPYGIAQTLKLRHHDRSMRLNFGSLYSVVNALEREGFIEAVEVEREGKRPERTVYRITDDGVAEARDWLTDLLANPRKEYLTFEAGLTLLGAVAPDEALRVLEHRLARLKAELAQSVAARISIAHQLSLPRLFLIEAEYVEALWTAEIEFVERLVDELREGVFPDLDEWRSWSAAHDPHPPVPKEAQV